MQFQFNEQQRMIRDMARDFTNRVIVPVAAELDATERFPKEIVKQMGELGLLGMNVEEQYGGAGLDTVCYVAAMEEVSRGCASCGVKKSRRYTQLNWSTWNRMAGAAGTWSARNAQPVTVTGC